MNLLVRCLVLRPREKRLETISIGECFSLYWGMSRRPIDFQLSREDQKAVREILRAGIQQVRVVLRAIALEQLTARQTAPVVARIVQLSPQAVRRIAHRY